MAQTQRTVLSLIILLVFAGVGFGGDCGCACCKLDSFDDPPQGCCPEADCIPLCDQAAPRTDAESCRCRLTCPQASPNHRPLTPTASAVSRPCLGTAPDMPAGSALERPAAAVDLPSETGIPCYNASIQARMCRLLC